LTHVYFTDRDLGKQFPKILRSAHLAVERHVDLFPHDGTDEQWLEYCGQNGRIALSHNLRIRYTPNELAAVKRHRAALVILIGKTPLPELAHNFVNSLRRIEYFLDRHEPPFIAKFYRPSPAELARNPKQPGSIRLWYPQ
jgi:hypothetical protein